MLGLYSLDYVIIVILILALLISFVISLINLTLMFKREEIKQNIVKYLYYFSVSFALFILLEIVSSVARHLAYTNIVYDYYFIFRYLIIIPIIISIIYMIYLKKYYVIGNIISYVFVFTCFDDVFGINYKYIFIIISLYNIVYVLIEFFMYLHIKNTKITQYSIKEALDKLPLGIIISDENRRIIFINEIMNNILEYNLISSRIRLFDLWNEIKSLDTVFRNNNLAILEYKNMYYMFSFDNIVKDNKSFYQIKCSEITNEINTLDEIKRINEELEQQGIQIKEYISKLEELEREKALIRIKTKIHDVLAQRLSIIHQYLDNDNLDIDINELKKLINEMFEDIKDNNLEYESFIEGIKESYGMIGMEIEFIGNFDSINHFATILKIVREAATNALRHSKASKLTVKLDNNTIIISNNGSNPKEIKYGNGLNGMMFEAKEVGYSIDILNNPFRIIIHLTNNA